MAAKLFVLALTLAVCNAVPIWINGHEYIPGMIFRIGRSPNMAYGFGSGFSSNIGGISHSTSIDSSFQSGDAEAYGAGLASSSAGGAYARGIGIAHAPSPYPTLGYQQAIAQTFNNGIGRNTFGSAVSSAQNYGGNFGSAVSSAHNLNGYGSAVSSAHNAGPARYQSAVSSAQNVRGLGYESAVSAVNNGLGYNSAVSSAQNAGDYGSALSTAHTNNGLEYNSAVSAAQNIGGYGGSSSQTIQQRAGSLQHSGASSVNGPGLQASQSHAVNSDFY